MKNLFLFAYLKVNWCLFFLEVDRQKVKNTAELL